MIPDPEDVERQTERDAYERREEELRHEQEQEREEQVERGEITREEADDMKDDNK